MDKLVFVGKNYLDHAKELGDAVPEKPVLFLKPPSVLKEVTAWNQELLLSLPGNRGEVHHECEIVLQLARGGSNLSRDEAGAAIAGVTLGLDMTLRTVQAELKKKGHPWTVGKVFADSAVVGPWISLAEFSGYLDTPFEFQLNGVSRQKGFGRDMMMGPIDLLCYISSCFPLCPGDLIFTGTPAGVGPVQAGDQATLSWGAGRAFAIRWSPLFG